MPDDECVEFVFDKDKLHMITRTCTSDDLYPYDIENYDIPTKEEILIDIEENGLI